MMSESVHLRADDRGAIVAQARSEYPNECCGLLVGTGRRVDRVYRTENIRMSPRSFEVDPARHVEIITEADRDGLEVIGYYHSHVASPAYPSATDVRFARSWPGYVHIIASLANGDAPSVRAFSIDVEDSARDGMAGGARSSSREETPVVIHELEVILR